MAKTDLTDVSGIGAGSAAVLRESGISSVRDLAETPLESLVQVPGFGPTRAAAVIRAAQALVLDPSATTGDLPAADQKKKKKDKKKKKQKKKDKKKKQKKKKGKGKKKKKKK